MESSSLRPRIRREVRFQTSTQDMDDEAWARSELLAVSDRSGNKGVLVLTVGEDELRAFAYELSRGMTSSTGRAQPVICDFCRTWQTGSRAGSITLSRPARDAGSVTFLCCADLACSRHVRSLTAASRTSRAQLREDMDTEQRVARLRERILTVINLVEK